MIQLSTKDRLIRLLKEKGCPISKLADNNETERVKLSRQINGNVGLQLSTIERVLNKFPDVSADWLILGRGPMYYSDNLATRVYNNGGTANIAKSISFNDRAKNVMPNGTPIDKDLIIQSQELQLQTLRDQNTILRQDNDAFRTLINKLK